MKYFRFYISCFALTFSNLFGDSSQPNHEEQNTIEMMPDFCCKEATNNCDIWIYPNYFYMGYTSGSGLSYRSGYGTLGLFLAPSKFATSCFQSFFDAKGTILNGGKWAASMGCGTRYILTDKNIVLGFNTYYDYRRFHRFNLNQTGIGIELLGHCWDFRFNGYIPVGTTNFSEGRLYDFSDGFFALRQKRVSAWYGVDAELGAWLLRKLPCNWLGIYFAAGPYYYAHHDNEKRFEDRRHHQAFGGRARILARISNFIDLSVIGTYDPIWQTRVQVQATLTIPFDWESILHLGSKECIPSPCLLKQIAVQPVQRNGIMVADQECCWEWNWSDGSSCPANHSVSLSSFDRFENSSPCSCNESKH